MRPVGVAAVVAASLVTCAWFALGIRQAHDTAAASAIVAGTSPLPAGKARHAADLIGSARFLNPDTQVDVLRAELDLGQGRRGEARRTLERVLVKEPENAVAWEWLARASSDDRTEFFIALIHLRQLVPPVPPPP